MLVFMLSLLLHHGMNGYLSVGELDNVPVLVRTLDSEEVELLDVYNDGYAFHVELSGYGLGDLLSVSLCGMVFPIAHNVGDCVVEFVG